MGESNLKWFRIVGWRGKFELIEYALKQLGVSEDYIRTAKNINIDYNCITETGSVLIVPRENDKKEEEKSAAYRGEAPDSTPGMCR